jgi:hypothetical protein
VALQTLSPNPDQREIDDWIDNMKQHRTLQAKDGLRLEPIHCPLSTCGKIQRRPQALRVSLHIKEFPLMLIQLLCRY